MKKNMKKTLAIAMSVVSLTENAYAAKAPDTNIEQRTGLIDFAYVLSINGNPEKYFSSHEAAEKTLDIILKKYAIPDSVSFFIEDTDIERKIVSSVILSSPYHASQELISENKLNVKSRTSSVYQTEKEFKTIEEPDNNICIGAEKVVQTGENGEYTVSAITEYINGAETSHEIISCITSIEAQDEIIKVGTNPNPDVGCGNFIVPVSGRLSSKFGARWGRNHNGIDIAATIGTPVYASDNGRVSFSGTKGSFGKLVTINHNNGYTTYYAHCNKIIVSQNEIVKQGQVIAYVGNTGNSTGPHCHFEIRKSNTPKNPLEYLN